MPVRNSESPPPHHPAAARGNRPRTWLVTPIYPSGHGAATLTGAHSSAPRPGRQTATVRSKPNGIGSYPGWVTSALTHPRPRHCQGRPEPVKGDRLDRTRTAGRHRAPPASPPQPDKPQVRPDMTVSTSQDKVRNPRTTEPDFPVCNGT